MIRRRVAASLMLLAAACAPAIRDNTKDASEGPPPPPPADPGFPTGWEEWHKINAAPILHPEVKEARDLYHNDKAAGSHQGPFPVGSVLVKAQRRLEGSQPGRLFQLAVMTKGTGRENGGWEFAVFDPDTRKAVPLDPDVCAICHGQRADNDFVFSDRSKL